MLELTIDEIAEIKSLVEKQKRASIKWVSIITGVEEVKIIENAAVLGLVIENSTIRIPLTSDERGIKIIFDDAKINLETQELDETAQSLQEIEDIELDLDSSENILSDEFSPTLKDAIRFCRLEIIFIFYGIVVITAAILLILGFVQVFLYIVLSTSCLVVIWILLRLGVVFSNRLIITDNEVIICTFLTKKELLIEDITEVIVYKDNPNSESETGAQIKKNEAIIFRSNNDTYTYHMRFFNEENFHKFSDEITASIKIKIKEKIS